jgi:hypothetical protein
MSTTASQRGSEVEEGMMCAASVECSTGAAAHALRVLACASPTGELGERGDSRGKQNYCGCKHVQHAQLHVQPGVAPGVLLARRRRSRHVHAGHETCCMGL